MLIQSLSFLLYYKANDAYSARISAIKSREIGWHPRKNITDFYHSFEAEIEAIAQVGPKH